MKTSTKVILILIIIFITGVYIVKQCKADEPPTNVMEVYAEGEVYACPGQIDRDMVCVNVDGNPWGKKTPDFKPNIGDVVTVKFTMVRMLDPNRKHEDEFFVKEIEIQKAEE